MINLNTSTTLTVIPENPSAARRPLLTPLPEAGHFLMVLDNSSMEKFTTCPQAAYNYLVLGREGEARNAALVFGGAVHAGLEKFLLGLPESEQDAAIQNHFLTNPTPPDEYRTISNALTVLAEFRQRSRMPDYDWIILSDDKGPLVEQAFEIPLGVIKVGTNITMPWLPDSPSHHVSHIHLAWSGRMDLIANWNGMNRVVDHKTTSIAGDQVIQDFQLSNQAIGYVWASQQLFPQHNILGFAVNFIHFKRPTGSGPITAPGPRGGPPALSFFPAFYDYSPERLLWWQNNTINIVSDFIHCLVRDHFPSHTKWCFGKYGKCSYHDVCSQDSVELRSKLIQSPMFRPVTWNPTADR